MMHPNEIRAQIAEFLLSHDSFDQVVTDRFKSPHCKKVVESPVKYIDAAYHPTKPRGTARNRPHYMVACPRCPGAGVIDPATNGWLVVPKDVTEFEKNG